MEAVRIVEWLDLLVFKTLNPVKDYAELLDQEAILLIRGNLDVAKDSFQRFLQSYCFGGVGEEQMMGHFGRYYLMLSVLSQQSYKNLDLCTEKHNIARSAINLVSDCLGELLSVIVDRYSNYLSPNYSIPFLMHQRLAADLYRRLSDVLDHLVMHDGQTELIRLIDQQLRGVLIPDEQFKTMSFTIASYTGTLIYSLETMDGEIPENCFFTALELNLVTHNFNSLGVARVIIKKLNHELNSNDLLVDKIEYLRCVSKALEQDPIKTDIRFCDEEMDLKKALATWIFQELAFLQWKFSLLSKNNVRDQVASTPLDVKATPAKLEKIVCNMSVDQIALFLKAVDDARVISAKSLSNFLRTIVPFLATPSRATISWESVRTKTYTAEQRDKVIVIEMLQRLTRLIAEY